MILLIDVGNSRIKWATLQEQQIQYCGAIERTGTGTKDIGLTGWSEMACPDAVYVCNVVGEKFAKTLQNWCKRQWKRDPVFLHSEPAAQGVTNAYAQAGRLGVDRWMGLLAAHRRVRGPVCVVDCGTAITLDALAADGRHLGGLIVPGLLAMQSAVTANATAIDDVVLSTDARPSILATDTGSAVIGGVIYAAVAVIDRVIADLSAELGKPVKCLMTGGDAKRLQALVYAGAEYRPNLVFEGMALLTEAEQPAAAAAKKEKKRA